MRCRLDWRGFAGGIAAGAALLWGCGAGLSRDPLAPPSHSSGDWAHCAAPAAGCSGKIVAGFDYTCALRTDSSIECWGSNGSGQARPPAETFATISAGSGRTCGIRSSDGSIICWGGPDASPPIVTSSPIVGPFIAVAAGGEPCAIRADGSLVCWVSAETTSAPLTGSFRGIASNYNHACAVREDGTISCWGLDQFGETDAPPGPHVAITVGEDFSCAIKIDGGVDCWGDGRNGQLAAPGASFIAISAGFNFACGLEINGTVACWGDNTYGQSTPPAGPFVDVSAGFTHACAVRADGTLACWGEPVVGGGLTPPLSFESIAVGLNYGCGLRADGTALCWGGSGGLETVPFTGSYIALAAGYLVTCGLRPDRQLACWGDPRGLPQGTWAFSAIAVSDFYGCGIVSGGTGPYIICWGQAMAGETTPPLGEFKTLAAGGARSCADALLSISTAASASGGSVETSFYCGIRARDHRLLCWGPEVAH